MRNIPYQAGSFPVTGFAPTVVDVVAVQAEVVSSSLKTVNTAATSVHLFLKNLKAFNGLRAASPVTADISRFSNASAFCTAVGMSDTCAAVLAASYATVSVIAAPVVAGLAGRLSVFALD